MVITTALWMVMVVDELTGPQVTGWSVVVSVKVTVPAAISAPDGV